MTIRTLILTRHAKSSWKDPTLIDHARPLNKRGKRSAIAMGNWLREKGWCPDQVISSSSQRTRDTYAGMALDAEPTFTDTLYHVGPDAFFQVLKQATGGTVLMLGHNPTIADVAWNMVKEAPEHSRFADFPTGATLVLSFRIEGWNQVKWSSGEVLGFAIPRELLGE